MHKKNIIICLIGFLTHLLLWLFAMNWDVSSICHEAGCWALIALDLPISIIYNDTAQKVTYGSLLLGSIWWGILSILVTKFFSYLLKIFQKELGIK